MIEYKSREYCRNVGCGIQKVIDKNDNSMELGFAKGFCKYDCSAYKFHKWLQENNYGIVKNLENIKQILEGVEQDIIMNGQLTAETFDAVKKINEEV